MYLPDAQVVPPSRHRRLSGVDLPKSCGGFVVIVRTAFFGEPVS